jgi:hypothetical protein
MTGNILLIYVTHGYVHDIYISRSKSYTPDIRNGGNSSVKDEYGGVADILDTDDVWD